MGKGGKKRNSGAKRYPNGTVYRHEDPRKPAWEARQRVYGVSKAQSKEREGGFPIGQLLQAGGKDGNNETGNGISQTQFKALEHVLFVHESYQLALQAQKLGTKSPSDFSISPGYDSSDGTEPEYVEFYKRAIDRWKELRNILLNAESPGAYFAVKCWVIDEVPVYNLLGDLRIGANAVARMLEKGK